jgi:hypothetical protein
MKSLKSHSRNCASLMAVCTSVMNLVPLLAVVLDVDS